MGELFIIDAREARGPVALSQNNKILNRAALGVERCGVGVKVRGDTVHSAAKPVVQADISGRGVGVKSRGIDVRGGRF